MHIAALLALSSALCVAVGDVLQQRATKQTTDTTSGRAALVATLLRDRRWRWGAAILVASIGLQAAALNYGSVLLVQPLHMTALLFALPINARLSRRAMTRREWIWAGLLTAAVVVFVIVGNPHAGRSSASLQTWTSVLMVCGPLLIACIVAAWIRGGVLAAVLFAFVSGAFWGIFAVLTKEVVHLLGDDGWAVMRTPELYAWLLVAVGGFAWGQAAFAKGSLNASMPILQVSQPVVAAVLGVVVLGETLTSGRSAVLVLSVAVLVMVAAVWALARIDVPTGFAASDGGNEQGDAPVRLAHNELER
jgi:drug/metabolite transporter (DMT)-like permease